MKENAPEWIAKITRQRGKKTERLFWQSGGGYDRNIDNPKTLWKMIDYIHANPIRRELVKRAIDWEWSSATWYETQVQYNGLLPIDEMPEAWSSD
jgi:putative transposase